jgi:hypothetical protein
MSVLEMLVALFSSTAFAGCFAWFIHLGNRVTILETSEPAFKELMATKLDEVSRRLARIELAMNGHLSKD